MTQGERRVWLIEQLLRERPEQTVRQIPEEEQEQRNLLRALVNVRMPEETSEELLQTEDAYLQEEVARRGIVQVEDLPAVDQTLGCAWPYAGDIALWQGDITTLAADAIVNAANAQMLGCFVPLHACIDNCIHTFAGIRLRAECDRQMRDLRIRYGRSYEQPTAVPMLTPGYNLPAKHVIHIVGPIVSGELTEEHERLLAACYANTLDLCKEHSLRSVAFCCISTGVFHFPKERAAEIAVATVRSWLAQSDTSIKVIFNVFGDEDLLIYQKQLA